MTDLEQAGRIALTDHYQLKIVITGQSEKPQVFYVYRRDLEKVVACPPFYAKVFKLKEAKTP